MSHFTTIRGGALRSAALTGLQCFSMLGVTYAALDTGSLASQYFGNDAAWYANTIPFFEISDQNIQDVYYYRWKIFRAHQRDIGERGYVSTGKCK